MKKFILFAGLSFSLAAHSQLKEGRVVYERTFQLPTRMFTSDPAVNLQIPKSRTDQYELLFGNNQSLWQYVPDASGEGDANTFASGGMIIRFAGSGNDITYANFEKGTLVSQREIAEKNYVVTDSISKLEWKLSDETKTVLTYTVHKATSQRIGTRNQMTMENGEMKRQQVPDTVAIVAWYTTDIPVPSGPSYQGQLPGLILELNENNGQTVYKAIEISPKVSLNKIKEPRDGKKLSAAEFAKERDRIMEEMRKNAPNGLQFRSQN